MLQNLSLLYKHFKDFETYGCILQLPLDSHLSLFLQKSTGLFALLDEESRYPNADDNTLVSKFNANCVDHDNYSNVSSKRPMFAITHFNGKVSQLLAMPQIDQVVWARLVQTI